MMKKRFPTFLIIALFLALMMVACGDDSTGDTRQADGGNDDDYYDDDDDDDDDSDDDDDDDDDDDSMNMDRTLSDEAQLKTIAFSGFGMVTGNLEAQSFFPPGKVADYWGFQYLRDNDPDGMGHNTSFLTRIANNILFILDQEQISALVDLAVNQQEKIDHYGYGRYPLMSAFRRQLVDDLPTGSAGLNKDAVVAESKEVYRLDGQMSFDRAVVFADIYRSLDASQVAYFDQMAGGGFDSWPDVSDDDIRDVLQGLPQGSSVAVRTYAGDIFSWYAGSVNADVYFCPERHGTYFGSFYMKDAPAIGHEGYSIDEGMTANVGQDFLDVLTPSGLDSLITALVDTQRDNLYAGGSNIVLAREEISGLLRSLISEQAPSSSFLAQLENNVLEKSEEYGRLDGEIVYEYAIAFADVYQSLDAGQRADLSAIRESIMTGVYDDGTPFDFTYCDTYFLYSRQIDDPSVLDPYFEEAENLFF